MRQLTVKVARYILMAMNHFDERKFRNESFPRPGKLISKDYDQKTEALFSSNSVEQRE